MTTCGKAICRRLPIVALLLASAVSASATSTTVLAGSSQTVGSFQFSQISTESDHTCVFRADGAIACWGSNAFGQSSPPAGKFTQVSSGGYNEYGFSCAVRDDGALACWGRNDYGQSSPPEGSFTQVSSGDQHTCGLWSDGTVTCWGRNNFGQQVHPPIPLAKSTPAVITRVASELTTAWLAGGTTSGQSNPPSGAFSQVSAGSDHTCGVRTNGTVACWGSNGLGQSSPPGGTFTQISAGSFHTCGVQASGAVTCWGSNIYFQSSPPAGEFLQVDAAHITVVPCSPAVGYSVGVATLMGNRAHQAAPLIRSTQGSISTVACNSTAAYFAGAPTALGRQARWWIFHTGWGGQNSRLCSIGYRHGGLLGIERLWSSKPSKWNLCSSQRRGLAYLRRANRSDRGMLGTQHRRPI